MNNTLPNAKVLNSKTVRSFATEHNLLHSLKKFDLHHHRMAVCKTTDNRWTAVLLGTVAINGDGTPGRSAALGTGFLICG